MRSRRPRLASCDRCATRPPPTMTKRRTSKGGDAFDLQALQLPAEGMERLRRTSIFGSRTPGVASENAGNRPRQGRRSTSENTMPSPTTRRSAAGTPLAPRLASLLEEYRAELDRAPLSPESRRTYLSKVRQFLTWLGAGAADGDPR